MNVDEEEMEEIVYSSSEPSLEEEEEDFLEKIIMMEDYGALVEMTMNPDEGTEEKMREAYDVAKGLFGKDNHVKALKTIEETFAENGMEKSLCQLQGDFFFKLAKKSENSDMKCLFLFASLMSYSTDATASSYYGCARSLLHLAEKLSINSFYNVVVSKAKTGLLVLQDSDSSDVLQDSDSSILKKKLETLRNDAIKKSKLTVADTRIMVIQNKQDSKPDPDLVRLKISWSKLDDTAKRDFMALDIKSLETFVGYKFGETMKMQLKTCLDSVKLYWKWFKCHICHEVYYCSTDCEKHILENHVESFEEPHSSDRPTCVNKVLAEMIHCGAWEPVDSEEAANLIKLKRERKEEFVYDKGWCVEWPVSTDEKRKNILKEISELLQPSCSSDNDVLSCSLWDWLIEYTQKNLKLPQVPGRYLSNCRFFNTPQCVCFLHLEQLEYILKRMRQLPKDFITGSASKVVKLLWEASLVTDRIDLERVTHNLLLDERLLSGGEHHHLHLDDTVKLRTFKSSKVYDDVIPKGDEIVSWVLDCPFMDENSLSEMVEGRQNYEIWLAVLTVIRGLNREKESLYTKKKKHSTYAEMLEKVSSICIEEDNRNNDNQRGAYEVILLMECEQLVKVQNADRKCFMNVVRDALVGANSPTLDVLEDREYEEFISKPPTAIQNDDIKKALWKLRLSLKEKLLWIDSKLLVNENMCPKLNEFAKLAVIENRLVVLPLVKMFLHDKLKKLMKNHDRPALEDERASKRGGM